MTDIYAEMNKEQKIEVLTAMFATAFMHHGMIVRHGLLNIEPPNSEDVKKAYQNDVIIRKFTDVAINGVVTLLKEELGL